MNKWFLIIAFSLPLAIFFPGSAEARNKVRIGGVVATLFTSRKRVQVDNAL